MSSAKRRPFCLGLNVLNQSLSLIYVQHIDWTKILLFSGEVNETLSCESYMYMILMRPCENYQMYLLFQGFNIMRELV